VRSFIYLAMCRSCATVRAGTNRHFVTDGEVNRCKVCGSREIAQIAPVDAADKPVRLVFIDQTKEGEALHGGSR